MKIEDIILPEFKYKSKIVNDQIVLTDKNLLRQKNNVRDWWNKDAQKDEIKSAAAISKNKVSTPFVKLPKLPDSKIIKDKIICDLGCGYGRILIPLAKLRPKMAIGVDISEVMLGKCVFYANKENVKLFLVNTYLPKLPFKTGSLDVVYSSAVILHLDRDIVSSLFKEIERVIKPGGRVVLQGSFPNRLCANALSNWAPSSIKARITGKNVAPGMPKYYSYWELLKILRATNIKWEIKPVYLQVFPLNINIFRLPFSSLIRSFNNFVDSNLQGRAHFLAGLFFGNYFDLEGTK